MQKTPQYHNPCVRCGKPRVVAKTWKETIGHTITVFSLTVCSDKECQQIVDQENNRQKAKRVEEKEARERHKQQVALMTETRKSLEKVKH